MNPPPPPPTPPAPAPLPISPWIFPPPSAADSHGLVGVGADLEPATLIHAYRQGVFPMPAGDDDLMGWWSPRPRGVLELDDLRVSRSLRRSCAKFRVTVDHAFDQVILGCAQAPRPGGWISPAIVSAYNELHQLGWAHSVETWEGDKLVGGMYGVQIAAFFAGESMFQKATDASKVALVGLVQCLRQAGVTLFDVQWKTEHLATLGVRTVTRSQYLARLGVATATPADSLSVFAVDNSVLGPANA